MKQLHMLVVGLTLLLTFTVFSRYIKKVGFKEIDFAVTVKLQERIDNSSRLRLASLTGDVMEGSSFLASPMISTIGIFSITILTFIKRKKWRFAALLIPIAFALMTLAEIYGKSVVHHPAPPYFLLKNPTTIFPKYYIWEDFSYPSGHAARALFLATLLFFTMKKRTWATLSLVLFVVLISISRIYLGHHWLSDVIGGLLLGSGSGVICQYILCSVGKKIFTSQII